MVKYTIGLIISGIQDDFTKRICQGIMRAVEHHDVNLVIIPGKYMDRPVENEVLRYEYQYNNLFRCVTKDNIDGLINVANCVCCYSGPEGIKEFLKLYEGIPSVLAATKVEGYVGVNFDNKPGIRDAMAYMIEQLDMKRIGLISAALGTSDADERKEAYLEAMESHALPVEDRFLLDIHQDYDNYDVFRKYLDCNPDIQGIVCENDSAARVVYKIMKERGLVPGKDIAVLGFDNTEWAANVYPGLSSVMADAALLGERCVELLLDRLEGKEVSDVLIPTKFIRRESIHYSKVEDEENRKNITPEASFESIFYRAANTRDKGLYRRIFDKFIAAVMDVSDFIEGKKENLSDKILDDLYSTQYLQYADIGRYTLFIRKVKDYYESQPLTVEQKKRLDEMESIISSKLLRAINNYMESQRNEYNDLIYSMKNFVRDTVEFSNGSDESYAIMLQDLDWLWVNQAVVYMFKEPLTIERTRDFVLPSEVLVKVKKLFGPPKVVDKDKQVLSTKEIFSRDVLEKDWRYSTVLLPLYFNDTFYGCIWCDITNQIFSEGDFVVAQLSAATRTIDLLRKFDSMSKVDRLTGLLNRRGFEVDAKDLFERSKAKGTSLIFMYIDMNNLKIINDQFGHENGDFALKSVGQVLDGIFKGRGIAGRIGGDEYAVISSVRSGTQAADFEEMIYRDFELFNDGCDKPYYVTVSIGSYLYESGDTISFEEALKKADEVMYEAKKNKKKDVLKALSRI